METTKGVPKTLNNFDEQQKLPIIPVAERILIVKDDMRKMLVQYAAMGMANPSFDEMLENLEIPEFKNYINHTSHICGTLTIVDPESPKVIEIIKLLAKSEPITALFRFSALTGKQRMLLSELSFGKSAPVHYLADIYSKCYSLDTLFNSIPPMIDSQNGTFTLQLNVVQLLQRILKKVDHLLKYKSRKLVEEASQEFNFFS